MILSDTKQKLNSSYIQLGTNRLYDRVHASKIFWMIKNCFANTIQTEHGTSSVCRKKTKLSQKRQNLLAEIKSMKLNSLTSEVKKTKLIFSTLKGIMWELLW